MKNIIKKFNIIVALNNNKNCENLIFSKFGVEVSNKSS